MVVWDITLREGEGESRFLDAIYHLRNGAQERLSIFNGYSMGREQWISLLLPLGKPWIPRVTLVFVEVAFTLGTTFMGCI